MGQQEATMTPTTTTAAVVADEIKSTIVQRWREQREHGPVQHAAYAISKVLYYFRDYDYGGAEYEADLQSALISKLARAFTPGGNSGSRVLNGALHSIATYPNCTFISEEEPNVVAWAERLHMFLRTLPGRSAFNLAVVPAPPPRPKKPYVRPA